MSKYNAKITYIDKIRFHSKSEAYRYIVLKEKQQRGEISGLELQPEYKLWVLDKGGTEICVGKYLADFRYTIGGREVVEDVKGVRTPMYRLKKKIVEARYGIKIVEVK